MYTENFNKGIQVMASELKYCITYGQRGSEIDEEYLRFLCDCKI